MKLAFPLSVLALVLLTPQGAKASLTDNPCTTTGFLVSNDSSAIILWPGPDDGDIFFVHGETDDEAYCSTAACGGNVFQYIVPGRTLNNGVQEMQANFLIPSTSPKAWKGEVLCPSTDQTITVTKDPDCPNAIVFTNGPYASLKDNNDCTTVKTMKTFTFTCTPPAARRLVGSRLVDAAVATKAEKKRDLWAWGPAPVPAPAPGCNSIYLPSGLFMVIQETADSAVWHGANDGDIVPLMYPDSDSSGCSKKGCIGEDQVWAVPGHTVTGSGKALTVTIARNDNSAVVFSITCPSRAQTMSITKMSDSGCNYTDTSYVAGPVGVMDGRCDSDSNFQVTYEALCADP